MPKKKKLTKQERREARIRKARQWVVTYEGSHIVPRPVARLMA